MSSDTTQRAWAAREDRLMLRAEWWAERARKWL